MQELYHLAAQGALVTEAEAILGVLSLVDLALTGSLLLIVIFSGYENFVSKIDHSGHRDWPEWMGSIDFTALKIKLLGSIVAISAIQLLKQFMAVKTGTGSRPDVVRDHSPGVCRLERAAGACPTASAGRAKRAPAAPTEPFEARRKAKPEAAASPAAPAHPGGNACRHPSTAFA